MDYSSFLSLIIYNLTLYKEKPGFHHQPSNYLISVPVYMCTGFRIVNLYPHRKSLLSARFQCLCSFCLQSCTLHSFPKAALYSSIPFCEVVLYTGNAFRLFCHILHSIGRSPDLLNNFLKFACIEVYSFCFKVLQVLKKA